VSVCFGLTSAQGSRKKQLCLPQAGQGLLVALLVGGRGTPLSHFPKERRLLQSAVICYDFCSLNTKQHNLFIGTKRSAGIGVPILYIILIAMFTYFEYGRSVDALFAGLLLAVLFEIAVLIALIPFIGFIVYLFIINTVLNWFSTFTGFPNTGLTITVAFWLGVIGAAIINLVTTLLTVLYLKRR